MFLLLDNGIVIHVCIAGQPINPDPKHPTPDRMLADALHDANIKDFRGGEMKADCDKYSLDVVVGHRQVVSSDHVPMRFRIGQWISGFPG